MNKVDYIILAGLSFFSFFIIWKRKDREKKKLEFEEEILNLENAVKFAIDKINK